MTKNDEVNTLAFQGNWDALIDLLREYPDLVNSASESKGYTPLHQAAWHGASLSVIGALLKIGADRRLRTINKRQTALDIASDKHPERLDLAYVLPERCITIAQLIRKVVVSKTDLFNDYDGNQILADRLAASFGSEPCPASLDELNNRIESAFIALTGFDLSSNREIHCGPNEMFVLRADTRFWTSKFLPIMYEYASRAHITPIESEWAVVSDLFDPAPDSWGLRGDLFLWMEMRRTLCHVPIPDDLTNLDKLIQSAFQVLTGKPLHRGDDIFVSRLARGGMSSGMVSGSFWVEQFPLLIKKRAKWLQEVWRAGTEPAH
ncbi:ankyrin repeat domain-containing protein [uncultured Spongiibacter sp.]|uniref:ankyrin repeat domain-containing protein n=1 Tax=uncultured Spongiibacter sp. TaxID=870896 RepID=UPI00259A217F|nr:ankyrin repeat domain-containing protein [uncultured Spongiibacter sp.]